MLSKIRKCARATLIDGEIVAGKLSDTYETGQKGQREALERSLVKDGGRIDIPGKVVLQLYEDTTTGCSGETNFNLLMEKIQKKQVELKTKAE